MNETKKQNENDDRKQTALFAQLVELLCQNAVLMLGGMADRQGRQRPPDLASAEMMIEMLTVLQTKTKNNLTKEENKMLSSALYQLQSAFAEVASKSGDFGRARKATEAAEAEEQMEEEAKATNSTVASGQKSQHPGSTTPSGVQPSTTQPEESKIKYTKKYS